MKSNPDIAEVEANNREAAQRNCVHLAQAPMPYGAYSYCRRCGVRLSLGEWLKADAWEGFAKLMGVEP